MKNQTLSCILASVMSVSCGATRLGDDEEAFGRMEVSGPNGPLELLPGNDGAGGDLEAAFGNGSVEDLRPTEICGNGLDDDLSGDVDEGCSCEPGETQPCFDGDPALAGEGACAFGLQTCVRDLRSQANRWGECADAGFPVEEICDGEDNDCDGLADEDLFRRCSTGCGKGRELCADAAWAPCDATAPLPASVGVTAWEMNEGEGVVLFGSCAPYNGAPEEFNYSRVPSPDDPGWVSVGSIDMNRGSSVCGVAGCRCGGDFTYFRTFVTVPEGVTVTSLYVAGSYYVDDGFQTTIFNDANPGGVTPPGGNLVPFVRSGTNTVVVTHVDDCCSASHISASLTAVAETCPAENDGNGS
jgi:hypothetical protein